MTFLSNNNLVHEVFEVINQVLILLHQVSLTLLQGLRLAMAMTVETINSNIHLIEFLEYRPVPPAMLQNAMVKRHHTCWGLRNQFQIRQLLRPSICEEGSNSHRH